MHRRLVPAVAAGLLTVGALTACTASSASNTAGAASAAFQAGIGRMPEPDHVTGGVFEAQQDQSRSIVTTGTLSLVADGPVATAGRIRDLVTGAGGLIGSSTVDPEGHATARLVLRIPAARFQALLPEIEQEGHVRALTVDATDVTQQVTDYAVRIANLNASIDRLRTLLSRATDSDALVKIESTLTDRQTSLEELLAQQQDLAGQVEYATLTVSVVTPAAAPAKGPATFLAGLGVGATSLVRAIAATLVGLGVALPWIAVVAIAGGGVLLVRRTVRRRARPTSA